MDSRLLSIAPTLKMSAQSQRTLTMNMSMLSPSTLIDICSVLAVTPEKSPATVEMLVNFPEARSCSYLIAGTPVGQGHICIRGGHSTLAYRVECLKHWE